MHIYAGSRGLSKLKRFFASILIAANLFAPLTAVAQAIDTPTAPAVDTVTGTDPNPTTAPTSPTIDPPITDPLALPSDQSLQSASASTPPSDTSAISPDAATVATDGTVAPDAALKAPPPPLAAFGTDGAPTDQAPNILSARTSNPKIDGYTGALTQRIALDVPPGRNGLQPDLALEYNSQATEDSVVGYGWRISIPYIQRLNKTGSQDLYNIPTFTSSIDGELSTTSASTTLYRARVDDGSYRSYNFSSNSWAVYDKNGTRYLYGATGQAQQSATSSTGLVYRWMLEEIRDTNNNYVKFVYTKDGNQIYPSQILYTGNGSVDGPLEVDFTTASRPDPYVDYRSGFRVVTYNRISQITAKVSGTMVRQYALGYTTGNNGKRSLLSSIQLTGQDDLGAQISLPAMTFSYTNSSTQFVGPGPYVTLFSSSWIPADANGDGINDTSVLFKDTSTNRMQIWNAANSGGLFVENMPEYWASGSSVGDSHFPAEVGTRFVDVNGDGKADIVKSWNTVATSTMYLNTYASSTGYAWTATTTWTGTIPAFAAGSSPALTTGFLADVNGDGLPDFEQYLTGGIGPVSYLGNGSAWNNATSTIFTPVFALPTTGPTADNSQLVDINGDGLTDWVYSDNNGSHVLMNNGTGFEAQPDTRWDIATTTLFKSNTSYFDRGMRFLDINGDGLPDFVRSYNMPSYSNSAGDPPEIANINYVLLNTGSGWATSTAYNLASSTAITWGSVTGGSSIWDGLLRHNEYANWLSNGQQAQDVISTITYPYGGSTDVTYTTTAATGNNPLVPFSLLVVSSLTNHDGFGSNEQTTYGYYNGKFYFPTFVRDRKFGGFASSTEATPIRLTTTFFDQGDYVSPYLGEQSDGYSQINHPFRVDVSTTGGTLVQKTLSRWDPYAHGNSTFIGLGRQMVMDYAADGSHRDSATDYTYSSTTDDLTQLIQYGEVTGSDAGTFTDTGSDKRTTTIAYATSSLNNLSLPYKKITLDNSSASSSEVRAYYDGQSLGTITFGNKTKDENWITGTSFASSTQTFDGTYGLVTQSTDRRGNRTWFSYDTNNLYPASTTNALSQQNFYTYNYSNGKVKQSTDPNGRISKAIYDALGRVKEVDQSDLVTPSTTVTKTTVQFTDNSTPPSVVHRADYFTSTTSVDTYTYLDGLSRAIQSRVTNDTSASTTVTDRTYDSSGSLASVSLPYFNTGTSRTSATSTSALFTTYVYDPLQRVTQLSNAAGNTLTTYAKWTTTVTDPNGNVKDYVRDAFGNLVQVVEHAASNYTTNYTYDAANNLTQITDALSNLRAFTYDGLARRLTAQDLHASGDTLYGTSTYAYDAADNLTSSTDPRGLVVNRSYDKLNRMTTEDYTGIAGTEVTNTYDSCTYGIGQMCVASSTGAKITNSYDVLGRVASTTTAILGVAYSLIYTYDFQGNLLSLTYPNGSVIRMGYNVAGLTNGMSRTSGGTGSTMITTMTYAPTGSPTATQFGNGTTTSNTYDAAHLYRLSRKTTQ